MIRVSRILAGCAFCLMGVNAIAQQSQTAPSNFKVVNNPDGGQYIYGALPGRGTMSEAVVYMLQQVHGYFSDRPEVGKFFQTRDGGSVATFFTVVARKAGDEPVTGLLIVARATDGSATGAVIVDERRRFASTEPGMMKALAVVWHPGGDPRNADAPESPRRGAAPLQQQTAGDGSAAISLPAGWRITSVASGSLNAAGPHGEQIFLGGLYQGYTMGPNLFANFVNISNGFRVRNGLQPAKYSITSQLNVPGPAIQYMYTVDLNDGIGPRKGSVRLGMWGAQAMSVDGSNIPERYADEENATLLAAIRSYKQNDAMMAQFRQGAMNRVQADIARAQAQSVAIDARREASTAAYDAHMDGIDRSSKITQDYILDRSVVRDTENGDRGTVTNGYADSLVRGNPDRYQIVANQDLIKGRDY